MTRQHVNIVIIHGTRERSLPFGIYEAEKVECVGDKIMIAERTVMVRARASGPNPETYHTMVHRAL